MCSLRHPRMCRFFKEYKRCKFDPCAYKHEDKEKTIKEISEKLEQLSRNIEVLNRKEKESERMIEKLRQFDDIVQKRDEKIQILKNKI